VGKTLAPKETLRPSQPISWIVTAGRSKIGESAEELAKRFREATERF
jgi:hypothetical protein